MKFIKFLVTRAIPVALVVALACILFVIGADSLQFLPNATKAPNFELAVPSLLSCAVLLALLFKTTFK